MSKVTDFLNSKGVHNEWDISGQGSGIYFYYTHDTGRGAVRFGWYVSNRRKKYEGAWYNHGSKHISYDKYPSEKALKQCLEFCIEETGVTQFYPSPFSRRCWVAVLDLVKLEVKIDRKKILTVGYK